MPERVDIQGLAVRRDNAAAVMEIINTPKALQRAIIAGGAQNYISTILRGIDPDATNVSRSMRTLCLKLFHAAAFSWGRDNELLAALLTRLGVQSEDEIDAAAEVYRQSRSVSVEQAERDAVKLLKTLMAADPAKRDEVRSALFGAAVEADEP